jgi:pyridoxamine 5'-phosphate oxidase family protein
MFSEKELSYLKSQRLARIATVSNTQQPDVAAVGFEFDGEHFYIGGLQQTKTYKYKNVASGNTKVALVIDDVESVDPWKPRGIKIHGEAEIADRQGQYGPYLKLKPERTWSWGIERPVFEDGKVVVKGENKDGDEE